MVKIIQGNAFDVLRTLPDCAVHCCVTSPPYWGLRDYGVAGQLGLEATPQEYVSKMVDVFREVRRVLRDDGTLFLNLGDSYMSSGQHFTGRNDANRETPGGRGVSFRGGVRRAIAYDTSDKAPASYQDRDCLCENLCDVCRRAYLIGKSHNDFRRVPMLTASPCETTRAHTELQTDHLPTLDSTLQEDRNVPAILNVENFPAREGEPSLFFRVSTPDEFSQQSQDNNSKASNQDGVCQLCGRSFVRLTPAYADTLHHDFEGQSSHIHGSEVHGDQQERRNQYKDMACECCGGIGSYPYYTTTYHVKPKDLIGIPWRVAFALQEDGWYLRQDIIWHKPNPMPESVTDRCTKAHEYIFLMAKRERYYYDQDAVKEPGKFRDDPRPFGKRDSGEHGQSGRVYKQHKPSGWDGRKGGHGAFHRDGRSPDTEYVLSHKADRNKRSVWTVATRPFLKAHFATFPPDLIKPCILAGCPEGGIVLDPFFGSGTTGVVATQLGREYLGIELNPEYVAMGRNRIEREGELTGLLFQGLGV